MRHVARFLIRTVAFGLGRSVEGVSRALARHWRKSASISAAGVRTAKNPLLTEERTGQGDHSCGSLYIRLLGRK